MWRGLQCYQGAQKQVCNLLCNLSWFHSTCMQPRPLLYTAHQTFNFVPFIQLTLKLEQRVIDLTLGVKAHLILITMLRLSGVFPSASISDKETISHVTVR